MIIDNIDILIEESNLNDIDIMLNEIGSEINELSNAGKTAALIGAGISSTIGGGLAGIHGGASAIAGATSLSGVGALGGAAIVLSNLAPLLILSGIGYGIYRFVTRISKYEAQIKKYEDLISKTQDLNQKQKLQSKLSIIKTNLASSQERARKERTRIIEDTKLLKARVAEMERTPNTDAQALGKLKKKLDARMKVMNKINAAI